MLIKIPNDNFEERSYILDIIFREFLGLDYTLQVDDDISEWIIEFKSAKIIFKDDFFCRNKKDLSYLKYENLPVHVLWTKNQFVKQNLPVLYGDESITINSDRIYCGIDIFASSFFMLTRWEEYVNRQRDNHDRFAAVYSLAFKNNFLHRPIVNEYIDMLYNMLSFLNFEQVRKPVIHELVLTHDVDVPFCYPNGLQGLKRLIRIVGGDILKRKNITLAKSRFVDYFNTLYRNISDPFDTFDFLMDTSEKLGLKSRFYFMSGGVTHYDNQFNINNPKVIKLLDNIKSRGHLIGFHPSYNAYNDIEQFLKEKTQLEKAANLKVNEGREHYLRFSVPDTWQIWEDAGMQIDSTCSYADMIGFRCGTGNKFSVFNVMTRKKLNLQERPLIVMDGSLFDYQKLTNDQAVDKIGELYRYKQTFTLLWHNSTDMHVYAEFLDKYAS